MHLSRRTVLAASLLPLVAHAARPAATLVGGISVTPLFDGPFGFTLDLSPKADNAEGEALLTAAGASPRKIDIPVNAFLVRNGTRTLLVDGGTGALFGPALGQIPALLDSMGVPPVQIDTIVCTHLHADHVGGLTTASGAARYPQAELIVQETEAAFWTDDGVRSRAPAGSDDFFKFARVALAAYQGRTRRVNGPAELAPGLIAMTLPGHTPGHMGVLVSDGPERLLLLGDIVHAAPLQFAHPEWSVVFDTDQTQAAVTRARLLDMLATDRLRIAGAHVATQGYVEHRGTGYALI